MTEEPKFKSRRELREAERAGLIQPVELPFDGVPRVEKAEVPVEPTGAALTRRQLRELEKTGGVLAIHTSQIDLPKLPEAVESAPAHETWAPEPTEQVLDSVVAEREEPVTVANPVVSQAEPALANAAERAAVAARAAQVASEFEAILSGAVNASARKPRRSKRFYLILTTAILLVLVGGLFIAASALGILK